MITAKIPIDRTSWVFNSQCVQRTRQFCQFHAVILELLNPALAISSIPVGWSLAGELCEALWSSVKFCEALWSSVKLCEAKLQSKASVISRAVSTHTITRTNWRQSNWTEGHWRGGKSTFWQNRVGPSKPQQPWTHPWAPMFLIIRRTHGKFYVHALCPTHPRLVKVLRSVGCPTLHNIWSVGAGVGKIKHQRQQWRRSAD